MVQLVSNDEKKAFLKWLLTRYKIRNRETVWLLTYVMGSDPLLRIIRFVEDVSDCTRSMTIYEGRTTPDDFEYVKETVITRDPEKAFHDLRLNQEQSLFIRIVLSGARLSPEYLSVLEDNPSVLRKVHESYGQAAETAARNSEKAWSMAKLEEAINEALDNGDPEQFYRLSEKLSQLKNQTYTV